MVDGATADDSERLKKIFCPTMDELCDLDFLFSVEFAMDGLKRGCASLSKVQSKQQQKPRTVHRTSAQKRDDINQGNAVIISRTHFGCLNY